ncbi:MAG TPA: alpha/beta fold hydrolase [Gemmatimonadales bacterium]|nr:alpha/beta fold hydrolase [Gemmatimonadales bacterium]
MRPATSLLVFTLALVVSTGALAQGTLVTPTGPFQIGTLRVVAVDSSRSGPSVAGGAEPRRLIVQVWYPAHPTGQESRAPYVMELGQVEADLTAALPEIAFGAVRTSSWIEAPPIAGRFPLIVFSHGMNSARYLYTSLLQDLASHGFVVAAIDSPFWAITTAVDGGQGAGLAESMASRDQLTSDQIDGYMEDGVGTMAEDQAFVAEHLAALVPRLDRAVERMPVGVLGHSMGGMAATLACSRFRVFAACASLDGLVWAREGVTPIGEPANPVAKPFLLLTSMQFLPADLSVAVTRYRRAWRAPQLCLVAGGRHNSASDLPRLRGTAATPEAERAAEVIRLAVVEFFRTELAGDSRRLAPPDSALRLLPGAPAGACPAAI